LGGSEDFSNKVELTPREHFVCHLLLVKMLSGANKNKMIYAISLMSKCHSDRIKSSRIFQFIRESESSIKRGVPRAEETRSLISKAHKGKKLSEEHRAKLSESHKGYVRSDEEREKISNTMKEKYKDIEKRKELNARTRLGRHHSEETKQKMSKAKLGKRGKTCSVEHRRALSLAVKGKTQSKVECPYCKTVGGFGIMKRWHFEKCKEYRTSNVIRKECPDVPVIMIVHDLTEKENKRNYDF
jgi:hypothetical protein